MAGGESYGYDEPTQGEQAVSWQTWSNGAGAVPATVGASDYGKLKLDLSGGVAQSAVIDHGHANPRTYTLTQNRYGSGAASAPALQIRGSLSSFAQDDITPAWSDFSVPTLQTWRYVQTRAVPTVTIRHTIAVDNAGDWTPSYSSVEQDGAGVKMTSAGGGQRFAYMTKTLATPLNVSGCNWWVDHTINAGSGTSDYDYYDGVDIQFLDANDNVVTWRLSVNGMSPEQFYVGDRVSDVTPTIDLYGSYTTDLTAINRIRFRTSLKSPYTYTPSVTFRRIRFFEQGTGPGYLNVCFDGAHYGGLAAGDYMTSIGLYGMFAVCETEIGDVARLSMSDLQHLYNNGHMICSYPYYGRYWDTKTLQQKKDDITAGAAYLSANGFGTIGGKIISTPSGGRTLDEDELFYGGYVTHITGRGPLSGAFRPISLPSAPILSTIVGPSSTYATAVMGIDAAITDRSITSWVLHKADGSSGNISLADFSAAMDYAKTKVLAGTLVVTTPDKFPRYRMP
jgi:hypothetical protein